MDGKKRPFLFQAGLKDDGSGAIYHYDPVGSMEELTHSSGGAATCLVQPFLDNQVGKNNRTDKGPEGNFFLSFILLKSFFFV
jgi:20S proteasome subunit beta 6